MELSAFGVLPLAELGLSLGSAKDPEETHIEAQDARVAEDTPPLPRRPEKS